MVTQSIFVNDLSVVAPGLVKRDHVLSILCGDKQWHAEPLPKMAPGLLPANERRRTTPVIMIALQTIMPLLHSDDDLDRTTTVFASSDGDLAIDDKICRALTRPEKIVSPIQFHNSVHNAPAGYWALAESMRAPSVSISAGDGTFVAGLLDAISQVISEQENVLFVAYDVAAPEPLLAVRRFEYSLGIALRLGIKREPGYLGTICVSLDANENEISTCQNGSLEPLRTGNPVGAGLPLLEALARKSNASIVIPYIMNKRIHVEICQ